MCCCCRLWLGPVCANRMVPSACWKFRCRKANEAMKKLIVFDLDGTLAESKASLDPEMVTLLGALLAIVKVAVISGGDWPQFESQLLFNLSHDDQTKNLSLLPTCGTKFYRYTASWQKLYSEDFSADEKAKILRSLTQALAAAGYKVDKVWGQVTQDRGSQITFSALGQDEI